VNTRRNCTCGGSNENCMFCFGSGMIEGPKVMPPSTYAGFSGRRNARPLKPCPVCGQNVGRLQRHLNRAHGDINKAQIKAKPDAASLSVSTPPKVEPVSQRTSQGRQRVRDLPARQQEMTASEGKPPAVRPESLRNEVLQQRLGRKMDATKDFSHNFREGGHYGSYPSHDDYSDEGNP